MEMYFPQQLPQENDEFLQLVLPRFIPALDRAISRCVVENGNNAPAANQPRGFQKSRFPTVDVVPETQEELAAAVLNENEPVANVTRKKTARGQKSTADVVVPEIQEKSVNEPGIASVTERRPTRSQKKPSSGGNLTKKSKCKGKRSKRKRSKRKRSKRKRSKRKRV